MTRTATVTVLKPHFNEYGDKPDKAPAADKAEGTISEYSMPLDYAEMLARQGLVEITETTPDPEVVEADADSAPKRAKSKA